MKNTDTLKLSLPADLQYLPIAQSFVRETAKNIGFNQDDIYKIELALEEAVANVVEHAFDSEDSNNYDVICERVPLGIKIIIREKGIPFDPDYIPQYKPADDLENAQTSGMGVFLMKEAMNEVSFHNLGMEGKETHMVKYLPAKNIEELFSAKELEDEKNKKAQPASIKEKIVYDVRLMKREEAIEISRCAYKSHGYTFFDDHIYYPERLIELNETDYMISVVAVTDDNKFMGHSALVYPYYASPIAEFTFVFVNTEYRGQGCMVKIADYLFNCPKKNPLCGIYVYSVTNHEFTQRGMAKFGIYDCGLILASSPETWEFKGIEGAGKQRMSVALSFKYLEASKPLTIYAPQQHEKMIRKLYANIGAPDHVFAKPAAEISKLPDSDSEISVSYFMTENCSELRVVRYGSNVIHEVRRQLRDSCLKKIAAIQLFLNLEDPFTFSMTAEFEKLGFFFAGIVPMDSTGDALILQYLNNVEIDYDKIVLFSDMAKEIRDYVKQQDPNNSL